MKLTPKLLKNLRKRHSLFEELMSLEEIRETADPRVKTICINFPKEGKPYILYNEEYWESRTEIEKEFLLCHEILHHCLKHNERVQPFIEEGISKSILNICMDIPINEMLVKYFDFKRSDIRNGCWAKETFGADASTNSSFEEYVEMAKAQLGDSIKDDDGLNEHFWVEQGDSVETLISLLGDFSKELFLEKTAGDTPGNHTLKVKAPAKFKSRWESIIKKQVIKYSLNENTEESWSRKNYRYKVRLPGEKVIEESKTTPSLYFFMDSSGSCYELANRFFAAAKSINPKKFDIKLFCFDDIVYDVDINKEELYGYGGTDFVPIEEKLLESSKYPYYVFIITDGYGYRRVFPKFPDRWHVILTVNGTRNYLPTVKNFYDLSDFE